MPDHVDDPILLTIRFYGLPENTDGNALTHKVRNVAATLEEMGTFDQREQEPAHQFWLKRGKGQ